MAEKNDNKVNGANDIVEFVLSNYDVFKSVDQQTYAVALDGTRYAYGIKQLREIAGAKLFRESGGMTIYGSSTWDSALSVLSGLASQKPARELALRSARYRDGLLIDRGDEKGSLVFVNTAGWTEVNPAPDMPVFVRPSGGHPLPVPEEGGDLEQLRRLMRLDADSDQWNLCLGWLVSALFSDHARPILTVTGSQGSGKTTRAGMLVGLVDPRKPGAPLPKDERDLSTVLKSQFVSFNDNLTKMDEATSDNLCRLVTGAEFSRRALHTDSDMVSFSVKRTAVMTAINIPIGAKSDLLERMIHVEMERISTTERAGESEMWATYYENQGRFFGALLGLLSDVMKHFKDAALDMADTPRMADHAYVLWAVDKARGTSLLKSYMANVQEVLASKVEDDPLAETILETVRKNKGKMFVATSDLTKTFERPIFLGMSAYWPESSRQWSTHLGQASESYRASGLVVVKDKPYVNGKQVRGWSFEIDPAMMPQPEQVKNEGWASIFDDDENSPF